MISKGTPDELTVSPLFLTSSRLKIWVIILGQWVANEVCEPAPKAHRCFLLGSVVEWMPPRPSLGLGRRHALSAKPRKIPDE